MRYFFLISYYNIHFTPFIDQLVLQPGNEVIVGLLDPAENHRPGFGWDDTIDENVYRKIYVGELKVTISFLRGFDVVGLLGIYADAALFRAALLTLNFTKAKVCIFSEGLKQKKTINKLIKQAMARSINSSSVSLFAIGTASAEDYLGLGVTRWRMFRFGFAVRRNSVEAPLNSVEVIPPVKFVTIGQLVERKRVSDIFGAIENIKDHKKAFSLDVYGDGLLRETLDAHVTNQGLSDIIRMRGAVSNDYLFKVLPDYDCLILSSSYDGWGAVVNEAMQAGLTVILSSGVRAKQLLDGGDKGIIYPAGDLKALSMGMLSLIEDRDKLQRYRENCLSTIRDYFPRELAARFAVIMEAQLNNVPLPCFSTSLKEIY
jgi:glycosyltransferase involved in cell wall biosynthesis